VRVGGKSLRGSFLLRPGGNGARLVNILPLEAYLRGVVPAEMGPRVFPAIEALKAQAVAARTYAVAHLGDHDDEGWDLCDTPACQVYSGVGAEQPGSDEAVTATAGEVAVFAGAPIDAMYHSTCAGHTEDAAALFPDRAAPYLKGVPCRGDQEVNLARGLRPSPWFGSEERLAAVAEALAARVGVRPEARALAAELGGGHAGHGPSGLAQAFRLGQAGTLLHDSADELTDARVLEMLRVFRLPVPSPMTAEGSRERWELAVVVRLGQLAGAVGTVSGRVIPGPLGPRLVADGDGLEAIDLTSDVIVLERDGERWRRGELRASTGSPATAWMLERRPVLAEVEPLASADARSAWTWWVREFPAAEPRAASVAEAATVEVREGVSGRPGGPGRAAAEPRAGWPRRAARFDLPDTLFVVLERRNGSDRSWRFLGRVGPRRRDARTGVRAGARGPSYREILATYYNGVEVRRLTGEPAGGGR
jgi:hypothetical protein